MLVEGLEQGIEAGEIEPHDTRTLAAALVGALAEALIGPLSTITENGRSQEALIATVVQFCVNAIPHTAHSRQPTGAET